MSWKFQKLFALVAIAAALVINVLPVQSTVGGNVVAQGGRQPAP
jgi:hypothetical protein